MTLPEPSEGLRAASSCCHQRSIEFSEPASVRNTAGMSGRGRPDVGVAQRVSDRAISAGAFAKYAAPPAAATFEALFDCRQHFMQQKFLPGAHRSRVDVLVAAEPGEAIGK